MTARDDRRLRRSARASATGDRLLAYAALDRRAPVLKAYLKRASNASAHVPIDKNAPLAQFQRLAPRFPVFRIVPRKPA
jgi:hypothetical protein